MRHSIKVHYDERQVCTHNIQEESYSKSPLKPKLYVDQIIKHVNDLGETIDIEPFKPFRKEDFYNAHTKQYVDNFFSQGTGCTSNGLPWSKQLTQSVRWTNSSLYNAIEQSIQYPHSIHISPTSGFHHARPNRGMGFCTFSGQVIASVKLFRKHKVRGAYLDLDGHYGNSIGDSEEFIQDKYGWDLNDIIKMNINPYDRGSQYLYDLENQLKRLETLIRDGDVDYIVWCHGADSHIDDDLGGQLTTKQWLKASDIFYRWLDELEFDLGRKIPLTLSLFGGYRADDYQSVINLHTNDLLIAMTYLMRSHIDLHKFKVKQKVLV